jgi:hypothetical protein
MNNIDCPAACTNGLAPSQYATIYSYQVQNSVRLVILNTYPDPATGVSAVGSGLDNGQNLYLSPTGVSLANAAGLTTVTSSTLYSTSGYVNFQNLSNTC